LFLESARRDDDPLYAGYVLMLILGLRRGELLGLAWDDIDLDSGVAHIAWQLQRIKGELRRRPTKTVSSEAPLPLPDICGRALAQRKVTEARSRLAAGEAWMGSGLVLTTRYGTPIDPRNFQPYFQARAAKGRSPRHPGARNSADVRVTARGP
jgi:integrase